MGFLEVLGVISGIMGFWSFGDNMFPEQKDMYSNYKVFVGIDGTANPSDPGECCLVDAGGDIYYSKVFNSYGDEIGRGGQFPKLKSGSDETITMWQNIPQQAVTVELFAGKDAVCIAAIGATLHDGTHWGWVGDWGKICGIDWYYSGITQPQWNNNSPMCTWIDSDHSKGIKAGGIAIHWSGFTNTVLPVDGGIARCGTDFGAWDKEGGKSVINTGTEKQHQVANGDEPTRRRRFNNDRRLVVSSLPAHSADELCRHPTSRGPSFVSLTEGTHCDMETRDVLPLCTDGLTTACFDLEAETGMDRTSSFGRRGGSPNSSRIIYW
ncbi:hypothetical protein FJTKL_06562 [Diaporthe vaccinii]|uniref:Uncharacterized protein n=1 Tax=Diaporthe vaccinii TaxID=105482 RepID=A0ABR4DQG5_9PEZI